MEGSCPFGLKVTDPTTKCLSSRCIMAASCPAIVERKTEHRNLVAHFRKSFSFNNTTASPSSTSGWETTFGRNSQNPNAMRNAIYGGRKAEGDLQVWSSRQVICVRVRLEDPLNLQVGANFAQTFTRDPYDIRISWNVWDRISPSSNRQWPPS